MKKSIDKIAILNTLNRFIEKSVKPVANELENNPNKLKKLLAEMGELSLLAARGPKEYGGLDLDAATYHDFKENLVRASGILTFLQTQHQTAVQFIANSPNEQLKKTYLPDMSIGKRLIGMGLSHLVNYDKPVATGILKKDTYQVNGSIHFNTGYGYFPQLMIGFVAEDEQKEKKEVIALIPFQASETKEGGKITYSDPMSLIITQSANTVSLDLKNWVVGQDEIVSIGPLGTFYKNSLTRTNLDSYHAGIALAALDVIKDAPKMSLKKVRAYYDELMSEIEGYRQTILKREKNTLIAPLRAWGIELANRCVAFATQVSGGQAIIAQHPINRISREANLFSVVTCDTNLLMAIVERNRQTQKLLYIQGNTPYDNSRKTYS